MTDIIDTHTATDPNQPDINHDISDDDYQQQVETIAAITNLKFKEIFKKGTETLSDIITK